MKPWIVAAVMLACYAAFIVTLRALSLSTGANEALFVMTVLCGMLLVAASVYYG